MKSMLDLMPRDLSVRLLSEWCTVTEIARLDTAMTNDTREWFLEEVFKHPKFVVNYHSFHDSTYDIDVVCASHSYKSTFNSLYADEQISRYDNCLQWMNVRTIRFGELCLRSKTTYYKNVTVGKKDIPTALSVKSLVIVGSSFLSFDSGKKDNDIIVAMFPNIRSFSGYCLARLSIPTTFVNLTELVLDHCDSEMISKICEVTVNVERLYITSCRSYLDYPLVNLITTKYHNLVKCAIASVTITVCDRIIELITLVLNRADSCIQMYKIGYINFGKTLKNWAKVCYCVWNMCYEINTGNDLPEDVSKTVGFSNDERPIVEELVDTYNAKRHNRQN